MFLAKYFSSDHLNTSLASVYSLYIIFLSQPEYERVQININLNFLKKLNKMLQLEIFKTNFYLKWIIEKLISLNAFSFGIFLFIHVY